MGKESLMFENEKSKFYCHKAPIFFFVFFLGGGAWDVDIEKVLVSNKIYFGEKNYKYFIGYLYNDDKVKVSDYLLWSLVVSF